MPFFNILIDAYVTTVVVPALIEFGFMSLPVDREKFPETAVFCTRDKIKKNFLKAGNVIFLLHSVHFFTSTSVGFFSNFDNVPVEIFAFGAFKLLSSLYEMEMAWKSAPRFRKFLASCIKYSKGPEKAILGQFLSDFTDRQPSQSHDESTEEKITPAGREVQDRAFYHILKGLMPAAFAEFQNKFKKDEKEGKFKDDPVLECMEELGQKSRVLTVTEEGTLGRVVFYCWDMYKTAMTKALSLTLHPELAKFCLGGKAFFPAYKEKFEGEDGTGGYRTYVVAIIRAYFLFQQPPHLMAFMCMSMVGRSIEATKFKDAWGEEFHFPEELRNAHGPLAGLFRRQATMHDAVRRKRNKPKLLEQAHNLTRDYILYELGLETMDEAVKQKFEEVKQYMADIGMNTFEYTRGGCKVTYNFTNPEVPMWMADYIEPLTHEDGVEFVRLLQEKLPVAEPEVKRPAEAEPSERNVRAKTDAT